MNIKKIISILLFCVSIGMIGTGIFLMNSNKYVYTTALSNSFNYIMKGQDNDLLTELGNSNKYQIKTNTNLMLDNTSLMSINGDLYQSNNDFYMNLISKIAEEDFISLEALIRDSKIYYKIKETMDVFYYEDLVIDYEDEFTDKDFDLIIKHLKDCIFKDLKDSDFTKSKQTLNINGLKFDTTKISLSFTEKRIYNSLVNFIDSISKDDKAIKALQKISKEVNKNALEELASELKQSNDVVSNEELFTLSVYVKSSDNPIRVEIQIGKSSDIDSIAEESVSLVFDSYDNDKNYKTDSLKLIQNDSVIIELRKEYTSKNKANLLFEVNDITNSTKYLEIKGSEETTDTYTSVELEALTDDTSIGNMSYKLERIIKNKEYKLAINLILNDGDQALSLISTNNIYPDKELPNIDVSGAKDELTMEEKEKLSDYINDKLQELGLSSDDYEDNDYEDEDEDYDVDYPIN